MIRRALIAFTVLISTITAPTQAQRLSRDALTQRRLDNLVAFARLYGYVRYFHPSDEVFRADWNAIAIDGARTVEAAASASDLATRLQRIFGPVAPTMRVFETMKNAPGPPAALERGMPVSGVAFWRHEGVRVGTADMYKGTLYSSQIVIV